MGPPLEGTLPRKGYSEALEETTPLAQVRAYPALRASGRAQQRADVLYRTVLYPWKSSEIHRNPWKYSAILGNPLEILGNPLEIPWKSLKILGNPWKSLHYQTHFRMKFSDELSLMFRMSTEIHPFFG